MARRQPQYSPKQVAEALQVSESSIKRWCDQGVISTVRTIGGHRRIVLDALQQFLKETSRSLLHPDLLGLPSFSCSQAILGGQSEDAVQQGFRTAMAAGDEVTCRELLHQRICEGASRCEACEHLIVDAMHILGEAWRCDEINIYQERRACGISLKLIGELASELPEPSLQAPIAVGGAPEGDYYDLPTTLVQLALREIGWNAISVGNNLPLESIQSAASDYRADVVWLSVSEILDLPKFITAQRRLASSLDKEVRLFVGGRALTDEVRPKLRYTAHCDNIRQFIELANMMPLAFR